MLRREVLLLPLASAAMGVDARRGRAAEVPKVALSAEARARAPLVEAAIDEVTVFSDRARVRRRGRVRLAPGAQVLRLPDLPGATFIDTVRVSAEGARVLRVEAVAAERERFDIEQARERLDRLDALDDQLAALADREAAARWELSLVTDVDPAPPLTEDKRDGRPGLVPDTGAWMKSLDFLSGRRQAAQARLAALAIERRKLEQARAILQEELARLDLGGFAQRRIEAVTVLQTTGGEAVVELEYFVPGAHWKPSYDLHFAPERGRLRLETAALVVQATGEDWTSARLLLSTAMPGRGLDLPTLLTWTLGEREDFLPRSRPRQPPPTPPIYPPPLPRPLALDAERAAALDSVRARLAAMGPATAGAAAPAPDRAAADALVAAPRPARPLRRAVPAAPPPAPMRSAPGRAAAAPAMAPEPPAYAEAEQEIAPLADGAPAAGSVARSRAPSSGDMGLALFEAPPVARRPQFGDPYLPAVSAGGLSFVYAAPVRVSVPSDGNGLRVPLAVADFSASAFYEATPALAATAYLRARVRNDGKQPVLRGRASIFVDGEFVGQGEIATTGPGGHIETPLGADRDVRIVRQVVPETRTTGVFSKDDETTYTVEIQIGNYKKKAISIDLFDQVPKSGHGKVKVDWLDGNPKPSESPDGDGVVRFRVDVPAGKTQKVRFRYRIQRPHDLRLYQR